MKLSNRNMLLVLGIVVAVVVTLTTLVYRDQVSAVTKDIIQPKKTSLHSAAKRLVDVLGKASKNTRIFSH